MYNIVTNKEHDNKAQQKIIDFSENETSWYNVSVNKEQTTKNSLHYLNGTS